MYCGILKFLGNAKNVNITCKYTEFFKYDVMYLLNNLFKSLAWLLILTDFLIKSLLIISQKLIMIVTNNTSMSC